MTTASPVDSPRSNPHRPHRVAAILRILLLVLSVTMGLIQAWVGRFSMNPDGVSYLDIGDRLRAGDLHALLNGYWSPLYGALLAMAMAILKPSPYWEFPAVHLVNFLIYLVALFGFDFFLREFMKSRKREPEVALPDSVWLTIGFLIFISASLLMITLDVASPDMLVATCIYLAAALLLRIRANPERKANFIILGVVLGFGYLCKTVMLPLGLVLFSVTFIMVRGWRPANRKSLLTLIIFLAIASPFMLSLSLTKRRPTFGDSGKLNYAWEVNRIPKYVNWQGEPPDSGIPLHPTRRTLEQPAVYEFATPLPGSYPPWYDPSYWYEGVRTHLMVRRQLEVLRHWSLVCLSDLFTLCGGLFTFLLFVLALHRRRWSLRRIAKSSWFLFMPAITALLLYSMVFVSTRYIAPFAVLLWFSPFSGFQELPSKWRRFDYLAILLAVAFVLSIQQMPPFIALLRDFLQGHPEPAPVQWQIANGLNQMGVRPGDKVASLGGALFPQWYRLARVQVVAEVPGGQDSVLAFWISEPAVKEQVFRLLAQAGAHAVIVDVAPEGQNLDGWQKIADTDAYVHFLRDR